jgi:hypothetical protein
MSVNVIAMFATDEPGEEPIMDIHPDTDIHEMVTELDTLDAVAGKQSVTPISAFLMPEEGDEEEDMDVDAMWHPIPDGLRTVRALSRELATEPHWRGLVDELQALERCLQEGAERATRFCLMIG